MTLSKSEISLLSVCRKKPAVCEDDRTEKACRALARQGLLVPVSAYVVLTGKGAAIRGSYQTSKLGALLIPANTAGGAF